MLGQVPLVQLKSDGLTNSREAFFIGGSGKRKSQMISDQSLGYLLYLADDIYYQDRERGMRQAIIYHYKDPLWTNQFIRDLHVAQVLDAKIGVQKYVFVYI